MSAPEQDAPGAARQRRAERTHGRILGAALDLFEQDGFDATTIDRITDRAGVARRTFFHHFPSKEAVLFGDLSMRGDIMLREIAARPPEEPPLVVLLAATRTMLGDGFDTARATRIASIVEANPSLLLRNRTLVRSRFESDVIIALQKRCPTYSELELRSVNGLVFAAVQAAIAMEIGDAARSLREYFEEAINAMIVAAREIEP